MPIVNDCIAYPHGYLILVDNIDSEKSHSDSEQFSNIFRACCKMQVFRFTSLASKAMKSLFSSLSKTNNLELSCLIVVILSHGGKVKGVYDKDRKLLPFENICSYFTNENSPTLEGKPKIFLFQTIVNSTRDIVLNSNQVIRYPNVQDSFIVLSTLTATATTSISYISKIAEIMSQGRHINFIDVLSEAKLIERNSTIGQVVINHNQFPTKPLYFTSPHATAENMNR